MLKQMDKLTLINLKEKGKTNIEVAELLNVHRKTVAKYWKEYQNDIKQLQETKDKEEVTKLQEKIYSNPKYDSSNRKRSKYNKEIEKDLIKIISDEHEKDVLLGNHKQQLTKRQIFQKLKAYGHDIGYTTITHEIDRLRNKQHECFIKQDYKYGDRLEYDFGQVKLFINGQTKTLYMAVITSPASDLRWAYLYENSKQEVFLDSHVRFFDMTKRVWREIVYDNMRNVVKKFLGKNKKKLILNL